MFSSTVALLVRSKNEIKSVIPTILMPSYALRLVRPRIHRKSGWSHRLPSRDECDGVLFPLTERTLRKYSRCVVGEVRISSRKYASLHGGPIVVVDRTRLTTYGELSFCVQIAIESLRSVTIRRGNRRGISETRSVTVVERYSTAHLLGAVAVPCDPRRT